jgi:hypothetical protein
VTGAAHHRRVANGGGYIRKRALSSGELRFEARLGTEYLGTFESREAAQAAIEAARRREPREVAR